MNIIKLTDIENLRIEIKKINSKMEGTVNKYIQTEESQTKTVQYQYLKIFEHVI